MSVSAAISSTNRDFELLLSGKTARRSKPLSPLDWVAVIRQGISSGAVDVLTTRIRISQAELAAALAIPERTLARRKKEGTMNSEESSKLVRLVRVVERTAEIFEDSDAGIDWLKSANAALGGATPLSLMDTDIGAENVMDTLGRIEHGVFA